MSTTTQVSAVAETIEERIARLEAEIAAKDAAIAQFENTVVVVQQTRREIYDELVEAFARNPEIAELMRRHYLNVGWKFIGRTALGQQFASVNGE